MKKCPFCGAELDDGARFCLRCMKVLEDKKLLVPLSYKKRRLKVLALSFSGFVSLLLAAAVITVFFGSWKTDNKLPIVSGSTSVNSTEPDTTKPDTTKPDTTKPDTTKPDTTKPDTTKPDTTKPDTTKPDTTESDTTKPNTTKPNTTKPDTTKPNTTKPNTTEPKETAPPETEEKSTEPQTTTSAPEPLPDLTSYTEISTKEELNAVRDDLAGKYLLTADIVFTDADFAEGGAFYNDGAGWQPIGTLETPFTGVFDGNEHTIKGLKINIESDYDIYAGLFGYSHNGTIQNLGMIDSVICATSIYKDAYPYAGGIVGYTRGGTISNCYNTGTVTALNTDMFNACAGGITGYVNGDGIVDNCYNTGNITATGIIMGGFAGGITGYVSYGTISNCYNTGKVTTGGGGGIVGCVNNCTISKCYNTGTVISGYSSGGIAGYANTSRLTIINCYNVGNVTSDTQAGGIVGYVEGNSITISKCYNIGSVSLTGSENRCAGGIVGKFDSGTITDCYYLNNTDKGIGYGPDKTVSCTLEQMKSQATFSGLDFGTIWTMDGSTDYPYPELRDVKMSGINISPEIPLQEN